MILDNAGLFSSAQALGTMNVGDVVYSTNWMDMGSETERNGETGNFYRDWAAGNPLYINFLVTSGFTAVASGATFAELQFFAFASTNTPPTWDTAGINTSFTLGATAPMSGAGISVNGDLAAGTKLSLALSPMTGGAINQDLQGARYLRVAYRSRLPHGATGTPTISSGAVTAQLAAVPETHVVRNGLVHGVYPATHASSGDA